MYFSIVNLLIFLLTTYFCLDIFGIIDVPENLSLAKILGSRSEATVAVKPIEDLIITEENIDEWLNENTNIVNNEDSEITEEIEVVERQNVPQRDLPEEPVR